MDHKKLIDRAEQAHAGKLSSTDCQKLADELIAANREIAAELEGLSIDGNGDPRPGRAEVLSSGDPQRLVELEHRIETLEATAELLDWHRRRCLDDVKIARARELPEQAKKAAKAIPAALKALEKAMQQQAQARQALADLNSTLVTTRSEAQAAGVTVAALDVDLAQRVVQALDATVDRPPAADPQTLKANRKHAMARLTGEHDAPDAKWVMPDEEPVPTYLHG